MIIMDYGDDGFALWRLAPLLFEGTSLKASWGIYNDKEYLEKRSFFVKSMALPYDVKASRFQSMIYGGELQLSNGAWIRLQLWIDYGNIQVDHAEDNRLDDWICWLKKGTPSCQRTPFLHYLYRQHPMDH